MKRQDAPVNGRSGRRLEYQYRTHCILGGDHHRIAGIEAASLWSLRRLFIRTEGLKVADAAHELRTPIAILNTRLDSLPSGPDKTRLIEDVARLATLAEQLLDIQRLDHNKTPFVRVDLVALGQRVAADLAPLAIAAGYELSFEADPGPIEACGDQIALERALTNLVQNAIQHGGRRGTISIGVTAPATIDVIDQGSGVPEDQRTLIFEPFYRMRPLDRGAGLGLNMVQEIVELHQGRVTVIDGPSGGACFRLALPPAPNAR